MNTMSKKMYVALLTICILSAVVITFLFYAQAIAVIDKTSEEKMTSILNSTSMMIEDKIKNTELLSHELINIITATIDYENIKNDPIAIAEYKDDISDLFLNTIQVFNAKSGWVVFDSNSIERPGILSYAKIKEGYVREKDYDIRKNGLDESDWWTNAEMNGSSWSDPYYWTPWDATIISYSQKIMIGDTFIGVGGSELFFDDISKELRQIKIYDTGHVTLLNEKYEVLFDADPNMVGLSYISYDNNLHENCVRIIEAGSNFGIIKYKEAQKEKITAYQKLNNGWILLATPKKHEMYGDLNKLNFVLLIVFIIIIALAQTYSRFLSK